MHSTVVFCCFIAVATAFPQNLPVVRPNHFLQQGTFGKEEHLLPNSFYTPGQQVEAELRSLNLPQQDQQGTRALEESAPGSDVAASSDEQVSITSNAESAPISDSYANIGGASGRVASSLTNSNEYGETVPKAFSNLQEDSYAYYHGHKA